MSKFSYDDLPWDIADQLLTLDLELSEGDITQKGYDKKRAQLLTPYQDLIEGKSKPVEQEVLEEDLGPEPSAADVTDFLDFLPSPTRSPVSGAELMEQHLTQNNNSNTPPPPPPPTHTTPPLVSPTTRPQLYPQLRPMVNNNRPPNRPPIDLRMPPPPRPPQMHGNAYPGRPIMNGYRPPQPSTPMLRPGMYPYRPPPGQMTPGQMTPNHSRTTSVDSKADYFSTNPNFSTTDTDSVSDFDRSSWKRMHSSFSINSGMDSTSVRRSQSNASIGRSRYRDSYMATTFKAIEPAPQSKLILNNPTDQHFLADLAGRQMTPLKGRSIPFSLYDTDKKTLLTEFTSLGQVLRFRSTKSSKRSNAAFTLVDDRGKESVSITWEKLNARSEKIAQTIRNKGNLKPGDRVALIYRKCEVIEFLPALFACFLAGVTAVPINAAEDLSELSFILNLANIYLILTTEHNHRAFIKDIQAKSIEFPSSIVWWKTDDMGTWFPSKKMPEYPLIRVPDIAYIEYAKASNGELKGVTVTHASIMEQCAAFYAATTKTNVNITDTHIHVQPSQSSRPHDTVVSYYEPRQQIGLIITILHSVYAGSLTIFTSGSIIDTPSIWIHVISKYKASMALADYTALKKVASYCQTNMKEIKSYSKKVTPDLSSLSYLIIDTNNVKPELNQYIADKLLHPLGNSDDALQVICPVLSLPEHGGKIISMKDNLGPAIIEDFSTTVPKSATTIQPVIAPGDSHETFSCLFDAEALKNNKAVVLSAGVEAKRVENISEPGSVCIESFGFCMPNSVVAIVDPETATLCPPDTFGEVWIHSPSIDGGFWALPKHTEYIFHARPIIVPSESNYPEVYNQTFLRTGLSGTLVGGRLFIFGPYEERVRQQRLGYSYGIEDIYYANRLIDTVHKYVRIETCTIFEILVKGQHLPVVVSESNASRTELVQIAHSIDETLLEYHGLRTYAIVFVKENGIPRQIIHGRKTIHPLLAKRHFLQGQLRVQFIKMDVDRTIFNLAESIDPSREFWQSTMAYNKAIRTGAIVIPYPQRQHTGMEIVTSILDDRTEFDVSKFTNMVDMLQWRTKLYAEEDAYYVSSYTGTNFNTKPYTWKKINYKSAAIASFLIKKGIKRNSKVMVIMPLGIDYVLCIYACLAIGVIPVPFEPVDPQLQPQRIGEFVEQFIQINIDLNISSILTNNEGDDALRHNAVKSSIKQYLPSKYKLPEILNISKSPKNHKLLGKESGFMVRPDWVTPFKESPNIILVQYSSDGNRYYTCMNHDTILNQCRAQKMTCQLRYQRNIVSTGLGAYNGLGFLYTVFCGVYVGCKTVLIPTSDFYTNPACFFDTLQRSKSKDTVLTNALVQFAMNRMKTNLTLQSVQNLMISNDNRPRPLLYQHMVNYFARLRLEKESINTVYSHIVNPMITTRSYMLMEPITLSVDPYWLRQGIIRTVAPEEERFGIILHDSGIVPSNTMIAIVNPETHMLCPSHSIGEIWVASDSNIKTIYGMDERAHAQKFEATIAGNDPNIKYVRTGDYGFLWNVRRRVDHRMMMEEGQCLYVLGPVSETLMKNGLMYFPMDIEQTIERCHTSIPSGSSVVFEYADELVAVVGIKSSDEAIAMVPLIVNTILDHHSFLIDTVVVVNPTHLPKSRFGEKLRRKVMNQYAEKKLRAIYSKRITQQLKNLTSSQSNFSLSEVNSIHDNASIYTNTQTQSMLDFNVDLDRQSMILRHDTIGSRVSQSNSTSTPHTT